LETIELGVEAQAC